MGMLRSPTCYDAKLSARCKKSLALTSTRKSLVFWGAPTAIRELFGSCGGAACQDILTAEGVGGSLGSDSEQEQNDEKKGGEKGKW